MIIRRIEGATRTFGAPHDMTTDECKGLPVVDVETEHGPFMVSAWEPTPAELAALQRGASIRLWVRGTIHPVVALDVDGDRRGMARRLLAPVSRSGQRCDEKRRSRTRKPNAS